MEESLTLDQVQEYTDHSDRSIILPLNLDFGDSRNLLLKKEKKEISELIALLLLLVLE